MVEGACLENRLSASSRGFESHSLRLPSEKNRFVWGGARVAEWACLLSKCRGNSTAGSNPALPAKKPYSSSNTVFSFKDLTKGDLRDASQKPNGL